MESKSHAVWTGLFTLGLLLVLLVIASWMGSRGGRDTTRYTFVAPQSVTGLNKEAPVLLRGIPVGHIKELAIDPHNRLQVLVSADIDSEVPLTTSMYGKLKPQGITGLMFVELFEEGRGKLLTDKGQRIPMRPSDLQQFSEAITDIVSELKQVSSNLNGIMDSENRRNLRHTIIELDKASSELPPLLQETRIAVADARTFMASVGQSAAGVDRSFAGMRRDFHATATDVGAAARRLDATLTEAEGALAQLGGAAQQLDRQLLPDAAQLIGQLQRTAESVDALARAQQRHPDRLLFGQKTQAPGPGERGFSAREAQ